MKVRPAREDIRSNKEIAQDMNDLKIKVSKIK